MPPTFTFRLLATWILVSLAMATVVSYYQGHHSYFFQAHLISSRAETARLYFERTRGKDLSRPFRHCAGSSLYRFPLPTGDYFKLDFAPLSDTGTAELSDAKIVDRDGRIVMALDVASFKPLQQIQKYSVSEGKAILETIPGATSPQLEIIAQPFRLEKLRFDFLFNCIEALPVFLIFFVGGVWATAGLFGIGSPPSQQAKDRQTSPPLAQMAGWAARHHRTLVLLPVLAILVTRLPDRFFNPQFWAEDAYFFSWALREGPKSLFQPYGGYLLLGPRLAELAATWIPLKYVPSFLNFAALCITLGVLSRILSPRSGLVQSVPLALTVVLLPHLEDILVSIENVQWIMALGLILLLISKEPTSIRQKVYDYVAAILCGLTGVFCVIFLPLFIARLWSRKTLHTLLLLMIVVGAALIQGWFVVHTPPIYDNPTGHIDYKGVPIAIGYQMVVRLFGGEWLPHLGANALLASGATVVLYWAYLFLSRSGNKDNRRTRRYFVAAIAIATAASVYRFKYVIFIFATPEHIARYFFIPSVLFVWLLFGEMRESAVRRGVAAILLCAFAVSSFTFFRVDPLWDYRWHDWATKIQKGETTTAPVNPPGWFFEHPARP